MHCVTLQNISEENCQADFLSKILQKSYLHQDYGVVFFVCARFICLPVAPLSVCSSHTVNWSLSCTRCPGCGVRPRQSLRCEMSQWDTSWDLRVPLRVVSSLPQMNPNSHVWNMKYMLTGRSLCACDGWFDTYPAVSMKVEKQSNI